MNTVVTDLLLEKIFAEADWDMIPDHMVDSVKNWVEYGWLPGEFLQSILENDIYEAVWHADNMNEGKISNWVKFVTWYLPSACHGNAERVRDWQVQGGYRGEKLKGKYEV